MLKNRCNDQSSLPPGTVTFIKYHWLEIDAYESWSSLVNAVENILIKFGSEYIVTAKTVTIHGVSTLAN